MIAEFTSTTTKVVGQQAAEALAAVAARHGLTVRYAGGKYSPGSATIKFEFDVQRADGRPGGAAADAFLGIARIYGFKAEDLGATFIVRGGGARRTYRIVGWKPRSKYAVLAERASDGRMFKFQPRTVLIAMGRNPRPELELDELRALARSEGV
jgi:hypothetical protein